MGSGLRVGIIAWKPFLSEQVEGAVVLIPSVSSYERNLMNSRELLFFIE